MTMTLEELRESLDVGGLPNTDRPRWFVAIDAAIRERDELRDRLDSALGDRIREFRRANDELRRAEKAESELLRLTDDCARLVDCINAQPPTRRSLIDRAERAESELAIAQNTINAQQDMMGALKRKLALSEGELAALKARIAKAPLEVVESLPGAVGPPWPRDHWIEVRMADPCACVGQGLIGKRVRLLVEE